MSDFSNWRIDCSRLTLAQRQAGPGISLISDGEIKTAVHSSRHWYDSAAYPPSEHHFFLIGYTKKFRFLLVDLSYSGDETLTVHDITIPDEDQIQELFCGGTAS
jgi:hypothetical protein